MYPGEPWWEQLVGGTTDRERPRRFLVVPAAALVPRVLASGLLRPDTSLLVHDDHAPPAAFHRPAGSVPSITYTGSFRHREGQLEFPDAVVSLQPYGLAQLSAGPGPSILRIGDELDFSAFLRDADRAHDHGAFVDHMTDPLTVLADSVGLGDDPVAAGPEHRLFVAADGGLSVSPVGRPLGHLGDPPAQLVDRWRSVNATSRWPCAVCLALVVDERDRTDALVERPWIARYLVVTRALRLARRHGRSPTAASGFGGRLVAAGERRQVVDATDAPVVLRAGDDYWAQDPARWSTVPLSASEVADLETLLDVVGESTARPVEPRSGNAIPTSVARRLARAGIAARWLAAVMAGSGQPDRFFSTGT